MAINFEKIKQGLVISGLAVAGGGLTVFMTPVFAPLLTFGAAGLCAMGGLGIVASDKMMKRDRQAGGHSLVRTVTNAGSMLLAAGATALGLVIGGTSFDTSVDDALRDNINKQAQGVDWRNLQARDLDMNTQVRIDALTRPNIEAKAQKVENVFELSRDALRVRTCVEFNVTVKGQDYKPYMLCSRVKVDQEKAQEFMRTVPAIKAL